MFRACEWYPVRMGDAFGEIGRGRRIINADHIRGKRPLVSSQGSNNGVTCFVGNEANVRVFAGCLTVANGGASAGECYYHPYEFVASDHVTCCNNPDIDAFAYQMAATCVKTALAGKYSFSHEIKDGALPHERIMLPVDDRGKPDWAYMASCTKSIRGGGAHEI